MLPYIFGLSISVFCLRHLSRWESTTYFRSIRYTISLAVVSQETFLFISCSITGNILVQFPVAITSHSVPIWCASRRFDGGSPRFDQAMLFLLWRLYDKYHRSRASKTRCASRLPAFFLRQFKQLVRTNGQEASLGTRGWVGSSPDA